MADEDVERAIARKVAEEKRARQEAQRAAAAKALTNRNSLTAQWNAYLARERESGYPGGLLVSMCTAGPPGWWRSHKCVHEDKLAYLVATYEDGKGNVRHGYLILPEEVLVYGTNPSCLYRAPGWVGGMPTFELPYKLVAPPGGST
jgi:hypothetical protein